MWRFLILLIPCTAFAEVEQGTANSAFTPAFESQTRAPELPNTEVEVSVFASGFDFPWGIAPLPDSRFLVSERGGLLKLVDESGVQTVVTGGPEVDAIGQGGLLDVAVFLNIQNEVIVYLTYVRAAEGGRVLAAGQGRLVDGVLVNFDEFFEQSPIVNTTKHFGSRIIVEEETIWITTGDRGSSELVQNSETTVGKIIRIDEIGAEIWSTGHRNIQGAILRDGELWTVEHGPRGGDELNRPEQGLNYGWPTVSYGVDYSGAEVGEGVAVAEEFEGPIYYWDPVIAPGGMGAYPSNSAFEKWRGDLFVSSLNPGGLMRLKIEEDRVVGEERILPDVGRVRDVEVLANGDLLVLIDAPNADILRVTPIQ